MLFSILSLYFCIVTILALCIRLFSYIQADKSTIIKDIIMMKTSNLVKKSRSVKLSPLIAMSDLEAIAEVEESFTNLEEPILIDDIDDFPEVSERVRQILLKYEHDIVNQFSARNIDIKEEGNHIT